ncbi:MAG: hypothetical protein AB1489_32335, partial [Acidobacteriota bacterium]
RTGNIELQFPEDRKNTQNKFKYAHYFRALVDRTEISFSNNGYKYTIYDYYEGEEKPAIKQMGVRVIFPNADKEDIELRCSGNVNNRLAMLEDIIPCDPDNALNLGGCK